MSKKSDESVVQYPSRLDERVAVLENNMIHIKESLDRMEKRFDKIDELFIRIDARFDRIDLRFERIDAKFDKVNNDAKSDFRWLITAIVALGGVMAHGFHWF